MTWLDSALLGSPVRFQGQSGHYLVAMGKDRAGSWLGVAAPGDEDGEFSVVRLEDAPKLLTLDFDFPGVWGRERPIKTLQ